MQILDNDVGTEMDEQADGESVDEEPDLLTREVRKFGTTSKAKFTESQRPEDLQKMLHLASSLASISTDAKDVAAYLLDIIAKDL